MYRTLLIVIVLGLIIWKALELNGIQLMEITDSTKKFATTLEVNAIARQVYLDFIVQGKTALPVMSDEGWSDYIREIKNSNASPRDPACDQWGNPYLVREKKSVLAAGFYVFSAGADSCYGTDDDIMAERNYR